MKVFKHKSFALFRVLGNIWRSEGRICRKERQSHGERTLFRCLWSGGHCTGHHVLPRAFQEWSHGRLASGKVTRMGPAWVRLSQRCTCSKHKGATAGSAHRIHIFISVRECALWAPRARLPMAGQRDYSSQRLLRTSRACARGPRGAGGSLFLEREPGCDRTTSPNGPRAHPAPAQPEPARPHSAVVAVGGWVGEGSEREEEAGGGGELRVHPPPSSLPGRTHDSHMPGSFVHLW